MLAEGEVEGRTVHPCAVSPRDGFTTTLPSARGSAELNRNYLNNNWAWPTKCQARRQRQSPSTMHLSESGWRARRGRPVWRPLLSLRRCGHLCELASLPLPLRICHPGTFVAFAPVTSVLLQVLDDAEESDGIFEEYAGLLSKFVADSNVNAQVVPRMFVACDPPLPFVSIWLLSLDWRLYQGFWSLWIVI